MPLLVAGAVSAACALLTANILFGDLNQDEGWYLYAARMVSLGNLPYKDFAYTQMPVMPFVYSLIQPLVRAWGLVAGRLFTAVLGIAGALAAAGLASRLVGFGQRATAALLAFMLVLLNVYQTYFFAVVKTYALTALFLLAGFLVLSVALERRSRLAAVLSGAILVLAAGTRTSAGIVLPVVFVSLCFERHSKAFHGWRYFGLGALLMGCGIVLPFFLMAPRNSWFFLVSYHAMRESGGMLQALVYRAGFLSRLLQAYFVAVALWLSVVVGQCFHRRNRDKASSDVASFMTRMIWACLIAVTVTHLWAPFPYDDYQVFVYPLFGVVVSAMAVRFILQMNDSWKLRLLLAVFIISLGAAVSSPINQAWFLQGRDRIWWRLKDQTSLGKLRETAAMIRSMTRPGDVLLTQDPYLAVESDLFLPHGLEMGQFSYFPEFSSEEAEALHVVNRARLENLLRTSSTPVAAFSGYAFAIKSPQIRPVPMDEQAAFWKIVELRYQQVCEVPNFGQAFTTLRIFKKRH